MLRRLRSGTFNRLAAIFALLAAFCFAMPPAAVAFGHGASTAHCLSHADEVNHGMTAVADMHQDHKHQTPVSGHKSTCCGVFCLSALATSEQTLDPIFATSTPYPTRDINSTAGLPEQLDRPPIPSLFV
jgi:hypothetical protein